MIYIPLHNLLSPSQTLNPDILLKIKSWTSRTSRSSFESASRTRKREFQSRKGQRFDGGESQSAQRKWPRLDTHHMSPRRQHASVHTMVSARRSHRSAWYLPNPSHHQYHPKSWSMFPKPRHQASFFGVVNIHEFVKSTDWLVVYWAADKRKDQTR